MEEEERLRQEQQRKRHQAHQRVRETQFTWSNLRRDVLFFVIIGRMAVTAVNTNGCRMQYTVSSLKKEYVPKTDALK